MSIQNVLIYTNVGKSQITETDSHFKITGIPITKNDDVMNDVAYLEKHNADGMPTMKEKPVTLRHPIVDGVNVSATQGRGLNYFSGTLVESEPYVENNTWKTDLSINKKKLAAQDDGERWTEILSNKEMFGVSTGLTFERNNESGVINGKSYSMVARGQNYDHLALLDPKVEKPAGGENTMVRFNSSVEAGEIIVHNVEQPEPRELALNKWMQNKKSAGFNSISHDDIRRELHNLINPDKEKRMYKWVVEVYGDYFIYQDDSDGSENYYKMGYTVSEENGVKLSDNPVEVVKKFVEASEFADNKQTSYNNTDSKTNRGNTMLTRDETIELLANAGIKIATNASDEDVKTALNEYMSKPKKKDEEGEENMVDKDKKKTSKSNSDEAPEWAKDLLTKVNSLETAVNANAEAELNQVAEQVAALNMGLDAEAAKKLGLEGAKAFLAANSQTSAAGFPFAQRSSAANSNLLDSEMPE